MIEARTKKGKQCAARDCSNVWEQRPDLMFFPFPLDKSRCEKWVQFSQRGDLQRKSPACLYKNCVLCDLHFENNQFLDDGSRLSPKKDKVPTIFDVASQPKPDPYAKVKLKDLVVQLTRLPGNTKDKTESRDEPCSSSCFDGDYCPPVSLSTTVCPTSTSPELAITHETVAQTNSTDFTTEGISPKSCQNITKKTPKRCKKAKSNSAKRRKIKHDVEDELTRLSGHEEDKMESNNMPCSSLCTGTECNTQEVNSNSVCHNDDDVVQLDAQMETTLESLIQSNCLESITEEIKVGIVTEDVTEAAEVDPMEAIKPGCTIEDLQRPHKPKHSRKMNLKEAVVHLTRLPSYKGAQVGSRLELCSSSPLDLRSDTHNVTPSSVYPRHDISQNDVQTEVPCLALSQNNCQDITVEEVLSGSYTEELPKPTSHTEDLSTNSNQSEDLAKFSNHAEELPKPTSHKEDLPKGSNSAEELPNISNHAEDLTKCSYDTDIPKGSSDAENVPKPSSHTEDLPKSSSHTEDLPKCSNHTDNLPDLHNHSEYLTKPVEPDPPKKQKFKDVEIHLTRLPRHILSKIGRRHTSTPLCTGCSDNVADVETLLEMQKPTNCLDTSVEGVKSGNLNDVVLKKDEDESLRLKLIDAVDRTECNEESYTNSHENTENDTNKAAADSVNTELGVGDAGALVKDTDMDLAKIGPKRSRKVPLKKRRNLTKDSPRTCKSDASKRPELKDAMDRTEHNEESCTNSHKNTENDKNKAAYDSVSTGLGVGDAGAPLKVTNMELTEISPKISRKVQPKKRRHLTKDSPSTCKSGASKGQRLEDAVDRTEHNEESYTSSHENTENDTNKAASDSVNTGLGVGDAGAPLKVTNMELTEIGPKRSRKVSPKKRRNLTKDSPSTCKSDASKGQGLEDAVDRTEHNEESYTSSHENTENDTNKAASDSVNTGLGVGDAGAPLKVTNMELTEIGPKRSRKVSPKKRRNPTKDSPSTCKSGASKGQGLEDAVDRTEHNEESYTSSHENTENDTNKASSDSVNTGLGMGDAGAPLKVTNMELTEIGPKRSRKVSPKKRRNPTKDSPSTCKSDASKGQGLKDAVDRTENNEESCTSSHENTENDTNKAASDSVNTGLGVDDADGQVKVPDMELTELSPKRSRKVPPKKRRNLTKDSPSTCKSDASKGQGHKDAVARTENNEKSCTSSHENIENDTNKAASDFVSTGLGVDDAGAQIKVANVELIKIRPKDIKKVSPKKRRNLTKDSPSTCKSDASKGQGLEDTVTRTENNEKSCTSSHENTENDTNKAASDSVNTGLVLGDADAQVKVADLKFTKMSLKDMKKVSPRKRRNLTTDSPSKCKSDASNSQGHTDAVARTESIEECCTSSHENTENDTNKEASDSVNTGLGVDDADGQVKVTNMELTKISPKRSRKVSPKKRRNLTKDSPSTCKSDASKGQGLKDTVTRTEHNEESCTSSHENTENDTNKASSDFVSTGLGVGDADGQVKVTNVELIKISPKGIQQVSLKKHRNLTKDSPITCKSDASKGQGHKDAVDRTESIEQLCPSSHDNTENDTNKVAADSVNTGLSVSDADALVKVTDLKLAKISLKDIIKVSPKKRRNLTKDSPSKGTPDAFKRQNVKDAVATKENNEESYTISHENTENDTNKEASDFVSTGLGVGDTGAQVEVTDMELIKISPKSSKKVSLKKSRNLNKDSPNTCKSDASKGQSLKEVSFPADAVARTEHNEKACTSSHENTENDTNKAAADSVNTGFGVSDVGAPVKVMKMELTELSPKSITKVSLKKNRNLTKDSPSTCKPDAFKRRNLKDAVARTESIEECCTGSHENTENDTNKAASDSVNTGLGVGDAGAQVKVAKMESTELSLKGNKKVPQKKCKNLTKDSRSTCKSDASKRQRLKDVVVQLTRLSRSTEEKETNRKPCINVCMDTTNNIHMAEATSVSADVSVTQNGAQVEVTQGEPPAAKCQNVTKTTTKHTANTEDVFKPTKINDAKRMKLKDVEVHLIRLPSQALDRSGRSHQPSSTSHTNTKKNRYKSKNCTTVLSNGSVDAEVNVPCGMLNLTEDEANSTKHPKLQDVDVELTKILSSIVNKMESDHGSDIDDIELDDGINNDNSDVSTKLQQTSKTEREINLGNHSKHVPRSNTNQPQKKKLKEVVVPMPMLSSYKMDMTESKQNFSNSCFITKAEVYKIHSDPCIGQGDHQTDASLEVTHAALNKANCFGDTNIEDKSTNLNKALFKPHKIDPSLRLKLKEAVVHLTRLPSHAVNKIVSIEEFCSTSSLTTDNGQHKSHSTSVYTECGEHRTDAIQMEVDHSALSEAKDIGIIEEIEPGNVTDDVTEPPMPKLATEPKLKDAVVKLTRIPSHIMKMVESSYGCCSVSNMDGHRD